MRRLGLAAIVCAMACVLGTAEAADLVLVEKGVSEAPIIVFKGAPPFTRRAADELAEYIEKISGAKPKVIEGEPKPIPPHAIWVGYQPVLEKLFPTLDFDFKHPEEILIAANENHLVIAGRDRWDPAHLIVEGGTWVTGARRETIVGKQQEYGTANAVYTFLQDHLGVRWLWPGEIGEDILRQETLAFSPFEHRYHPQFLQRALFYRSMLGSRAGRSHDWTRFQRLQLDSLVMPGGHPFDRWWERFHEDHREYFALQPDGTRSGFPDPRTVKLCMSNPGVWQQWLADVEEQLKEDPTRTAFGAGENDSHSSGICVCENCRAWDALDGQPWRYRWQGVAQEYVAMTDRYITFWNHLARMLRERFPDREYYVVVSTYGPGGPPPVAARLADNTISGMPGHFPFTTDEERRRQKEKWQERAKTASKLRYRPNLWWWGGGHWGLPEVAMTKTIEDFRWVAENDCIGLFVDTAWEHWATQGPQYYLMAQLAWDPYQDGQAVLDDYYRRGFGDAAAEVEAYWTMMEEARDTFMNRPDFTRRVQEQIERLFPAVYSDNFLRRAGELLDNAEAKVAGGPEVYGKRVAFVRAGYEFTRLMMETIPLMKRVRETGGKDAEAVRQAVANWEAIERIEQDAGPHSIVYSLVSARVHGGYRGGVQDYFGPPSEAFIKAAERAAREGPQAEAAPAREAATPDRAPREAVEFKRTPPEEAGWELIFEDDFAREELGPNWKVIEGNWSVQEGHLRGSGTLVSARGFPGFQRLEFEAVTDVRPVALLGAAAEAVVSVSDISSFIQARLEENVSPTRPGYFFQFGGFMNTRNRLRRAGVDLWADEDPKTLITPGKVHHIIVENDEGRVRFIVDGTLVVEHSETEFIVGPGQDRFGFYFYTAVKVGNVKLYVKPLMDDMI